jgi:hypothetical protein
VYLFLLAGTYPENHLLNETKRVEWIEEKLSLVQEHHLDGFNIDFESQVPRTGLEAAGLTALVRETTRRFHDALPSSQVIVKCLITGSSNLKNGTYKQIWCRILGPLHLQMCCQQGCGISTVFLK